MAEILLVMEPGVTATRCGRSGSPQSFRTGGLATTRESWYSEGTAPNKRGKRKAKHMNDTELKSHFSAMLRAETKLLQAHLTEVHGIAEPPTSKAACDKLHRAQDHRPPAEDAKTAANTAVLAGVTRKDTAPAANAPKPRPSQRKRATETVTVKDSKPASKPARKPARAATSARKPAAQPATTVVFYLLNDFEVHKPGCRVIARELKKSDYAEAVPLTETTEEAVVRFLWDDQIREAYEGDGEPSAAWLEQHSYVGSVNFHSCTAGILTPFSAQANGHSPREHNQEVVLPASGRGATAGFANRQCRHAAAQAR